jgi:DNA-binding beta-propeller fold protein YncE
MRFRLLVAVLIGATLSLGLAPFMRSQAPPGLLLDPEGLAIDPTSGTIFVADEDRCELFAFRPDGTVIARLAAHPALPMPGAFVTTGGSLVVDGPGHLVLIRCQDLLEVTLADGVFRTGRVWGTKGVGPGQFLGLEGISLDAAGRIHVAEEDTRRVQVLTKDGAPLSSIPMPEEPEGLFVDGDLAWVTFAKADWVGAFDRSGALVHRLGDEGQLDVPDAVVVVGGLVYVADQGNDRVVVFRKDGTLVRTIGSSGGEGALDTPEDMAVGPDGLLYVADSGHRRVAVFRLTGEFVRSFP